jgi:L,D-transpeptidase YcbB
MNRMRRNTVFLLTLLASAPAVAQQAPVSILPPAVSPVPAAPPKSILPGPNTDNQIVAPVVVPTIAPKWSVVQAQSLLKAIGEADSHGLKSTDYQPEALTRAIAAGEGEALNSLATLIFGQLASDLREGRTPSSARVQWFVRDPDAGLMPTDMLLTQALATGDVPATLKQLEPKHPDYAALREALAKTTDPTRRAVIQTNLERWRWLPADLGIRYVNANVPEYQLRVVARGKNVVSYRTVVGKVGRTATPQLAEMATGIVAHPTWTVPQSIIKESVGAMIRNSPGAARARGYTWTQTAGGGLSVVQKSGPGNSLGMMKVDMPNAHAIFVHDTNAKGLFGRPSRALSHGCIRTDRAVELAIVLAIMQAGMTAEDAATIFKAGDNARMPFTDKIPVYINYFTMASTGDGKLATFADIYGRDAPVIASLGRARVDKSVPQPKQEIKAIDAPGA